MAKNKGSRILITLECTECRSNENKRSYRKKIDVITQNVLN